MVYKPLIVEPEKSKYLLYRYATRLLLERVSWLCRDQRKSGEGDGFTEGIFSNRSNISYEEIRNYLRLLRKQVEANPLRVQVDPTVVDPDRIRTVEYSKLAGLQAAVAAASSIHFALKVNRYGETFLACASLRRCASSARTAKKKRVLIPPDVNALYFFGEPF
jgi:hypothetical protein